MNVKQGLKEMRPWKNALCRAIYLTGSDSLYAQYVGRSASLLSSGIILQIKVKLNKYDNEWRKSCVSVGWPCPSQHCFYNLLCSTPPAKQKPKTVTELAATASS